MKSHVHTHSHTQRWSEELATISQQHSHNCTEETNGNLNSLSTSFEDIGEVILPVPSSLYEISRYDDLLETYIKIPNGSFVHCVESYCFNPFQVSFGW